MPFSKVAVLRLSDRDLDFLIDIAAGDVRDRSNLKKIIRKDDDFRRSFIEDEKVFRKIMDDDEILLKISPVLFFEILLRKAARELAKVNYTLEKTRSMSIPVFDSQDLVNLLNKDTIVVYLADMLASFTRIESYTFTFRSGKGISKKIRFNDMDIDSLIGFSQVIEANYRLGLYKRIADICLFILGIYPDFAADYHRYPLSGEMRPQIGAKAKKRLAEYAKTGAHFYKVAAEHGASSEAELSEVFRLLHQHFEKAKKPLNYIADYFLKTKRHVFFA